MAQLQDRTSDHPCSDLLLLPTHQDSNTMPAPVENKMGDRSVSALCAQSDAPPSSQSDILVKSTVFESVRDDEVQFVVSIPRRRKKKRRKIDPLQNVSQIPQPQPLPDPPSKPKPDMLVPTNLPRRGTTGMIQKQESCCMAGQEPPKRKAGSLPAKFLHSTVVLDPQLLNFNLAATDSTVEQSEPFTDFPDSMDWWTDQIPSIQDGNPLQYGWNFFPLNDEVFKKRKRTDDTISLESSPVPQIHQPLQIPNISRNFNSGSVPPNFGLLSGTGIGDFRSWGTTACSDNTKNNPSLPATPNTSTTRPNPSSCVSITHTSAISPEVSPPSILTPPRCASLPKQQPISHFISPRRKPHGLSSHVSIQVPASLVPDQSVSPRTKTVEISRPLVPNQYQSPYSVAEATNNKQSMPSPPVSSNHSTSFLSTGSYSGITQADSPSISGNDSSFVVQPSPPTQYDILRKPSLYKLPAWPAPIPFPPTIGGLSNLESSGRGSALDRNQKLREPSTQTRSHANTGSIQELSASPPCGTFQLHSASTSSPATPCQSGKKHAPNLVVDIAETCQASFPFAAVAARHNVPIQKVFDTFSAVIQLPLLRHAADNRRHGSLGKRRLKEFREARKAMEKATKEERKKQDTGGKGLLKEAISNRKKERQGI